MEKKSKYNRGTKAHYKELAKKSQDARIRRHIKAEVVLDRDVVTTIPCRGKESDCGYDIAAAISVSIKPGQIGKIETGVRVRCPKGYAFLIWPRSSWLQRGASLRQNLIDATYTGPLSVWMKNESDAVIKIDVGNKVAQLLFIPQIHVEFHEVKEFTEEEGDRKGAGYGSTGK